MPVDLLTTRGNVGMSKRRFPGFAACMRLMRERSPAAQEEGFHALLPRAAEFVEPLIEEFRAERRDMGLRRWLLELIGEARDPRALAFLVEQLDSPDESLRGWAVRGLRALDTPEARQALFLAGVRS